MPSRPVTPALAALAGLLLGGCQLTFESIEERTMIYTGENVYRLEAPGGGAVLVAPNLNGRVLTSQVGPVESVGYVNLAAIRRGETDEQFNNFGGQDRIWLGPEAEAFGFYFEPGVEQTRENWKVPPALNEGSMRIISSDQSRGNLVLGRDIELTNYRGAVFRARLEREIGIIDPGALNEEIGLPLPEGVSLTASFSLNRLTNIGDSRWGRSRGIPSIWILGQFNAGPRTVIIAPFRPGDDAELGPPFFDEYFGKVSESTPERLKVLDSAVVFKADARSEGKFGIGPRRTTGFAGSFDPDQDLLVITRFDYHPDAPLHASFTWKEQNLEPYSGDVFQAYNAERSGNREFTFYELESASPCVELSPGESQSHRHAVFCFQGDRDALDGIARKVLGVDLRSAVEAVR